MLFYYYIGTSTNGTSWTKQTANGGYLTDVIFAGDKFRTVGQEGLYTGFWSLLKRGFIGTYQYISKKHLQLYVDEFVFRYNTKMISEYDRFIHLLSNMCVRTRYNDLKIA